MKIATTVTTWCCAGAIDNNGALQESRRCDRKAKTRRGLSL